MKLSEVSVPHEDRVKHCREEVKIEVDHMVSGLVERLGNDYVLVGRIEPRPDKHEV